MVKWNKDNAFVMFKHSKEIRQISHTDNNVIWFTDKSFMYPIDFHLVKPITLKKMFADYDNLHDKHIKFRDSPNECHKDAVWILNPYIKIYADEFVYSIPYGCKDDRLNYEKNKAHSSWSVDIKSRENENYVDFCFRLYNNYNKILNGNY